MYVIIFRSKPQQVVAFYLTWIPWRCTLLQSLPCIHSIIARGSRVYLSLSLNYVSISKRLIVLKIRNTYKLSTWTSYCWLVYFYLCCEFDYRNHSSRPWKLAKSPILGSKFQLFEWNSSFSFWWIEAASKPWATTSWTHR